MEDIMKVEKSEYRAKVRISRDEAELLKADVITLIVKGEKSIDG
jgi:predicted RNA-binding protein